MTELEQAAALRLADNLENLEATGSGGDYFVLTEWSQRRALEAASELRRLDAENKALMNLLRRAQPAQAVPVLTEQEIVKCLTASGCVGTIKMSYDSGPYEITRTSINADRFARAVEAAVRAKLGVAVPMTDPQLQTSEERRATGERIMALATNELSDLVRRARAIVVGHQRGSISLVQRHLRISYNTAAKLLEALEQQGVVSPQRQNGQREVLVLPDISGIVGKEGGNG